MDSTEQSGTVYGAPFLGNKIKVVEYGPRKNYHEVSYDDQCRVLGKFGETLQLVPINCGRDASKFGAITSAHIWE